MCCNLQIIMVRYLQSLTTTNDYKRLPTMTKDTCGNRIKQRLAELNMTQSELSRKVNINKATISQYVSEKYLPTQERVESIANALDVDPAWLMGFDVPKTGHTSTVPSNVSVPAARAIPILGTICAGDGIICEQNYDGYFFIDSSVKADYCLHVEGDSMIDAEIYDGDIAFIKKDFYYEDGKVYAVVFGVDEKASLKILYREEGHWILMPCNSEYKPIIADPDDVCIVGECIGVYRAV